MNEYIKTPLNYTGNKFRLLNQIQEYFPKKINVMVDLFCGGATVGLNTECKEVYFVDNDKMVIGLLKFFSRQNFKTLLKKIEIIINEYGLSNSYRNGYAFYKKQINDKNKNNGLKEFNANAFYKLRNKYNSFDKKDTDEAFIILYILLLYGFNNDLRFNNKGDFNLPVGKTDLNKMNVIKLGKYLEKIKTINVHYVCSDFDSNIVKNILKSADFIYMDPPYLITKATYNESNKWNNHFEHRLLNLMDELIINNKNFILSNVLSKKGKMNEPLFYWSEKNKKNIELKHLEYSYKSSSYHKINRDSNEDEIIIIRKNKNENK